MDSDNLPQRIVSLQPSATVILHALGQLHRVVACTKYCVDVCPEAGTGRSIVDDSWTAHASEIVAASPDLVLAAVPYQAQSVAEILKAGARFLGLSPKTLADIYTDISVLAGITGASERGRQIVAQMQGEIESARRRTAALPRVRVFCEEWGKPLIASQSWVAELVDAAGGVFVSRAGAQLTAAEVAAADPDVLVAAWCGAGDRVPLTKIVEERGWSDLRAVCAGHVYCIRDEHLNTPAPTLVQGLHALAAALHPAQFPRTEGLRSITDVSRESRTQGATLV